MTLVISSADAFQSEEDSNQTEGKCIVTKTPAMNQSANPPVASYHLGLTV